MKQDELHEFADIVAYVTKKIAADYSMPDETALKTVQVSLAYLSAQDKLANSLIAQWAAEPTPHKA